MSALRQASPQALRKAFCCHASPRLLVSICGRGSLGVVEHGSQPAGHRDIDATAGLALPQPYPSAVIGGPRKYQQVALPLSGFQREHQRTLQWLGRDRHERSDVLLLPYLLRAVGVIQTLDALGRSVQREPARSRPRQQPHQDRPRIVRLSRTARHAVAPFEKVARHSRIVECRERQIAERSFDAGELLQIVGLRAWPQP